MGAIENEKVYGLTVRESANDGSDFTNPDADYRRLFLGEDGLLHLKDSAGTVTTPGQGGIQATLADAKGDLIVATDADTFGRRAVGTDGQVLTADSGETDGVKWATPSSTSLVAPTFVAIGTAANGTGDITPTLPAGHTTDDILLLFVQTSNQTVTAPAGWTQLGPAVGFGTAAAAGSMRLTTFWKRHDGSESDPTVSDPGDHAIAQIMAIRGCVSTGDPFLNIGTARKTTASTTGTAPGGGTPVDACLVVAAFAHALDSASAVFSSPTNADLSSVTERIDVATTDGTGGGIGVITGVKAAAGTFAATTATETSTTDVAQTFVLLPDGVTQRSGFIDTQIFLTPGFADTWSKPTGARIVETIGVGGGGGGGAGRNAATAAGGGGGGGGMFMTATASAAELASTMTVTAGAGGAATANSDGAAGNNGTDSTVASGGKNILFAAAGGGGAGATSGAGGAGGTGGGRGVATAAGVFAYSMQPVGGAAGGTTAGAGGPGYDQSGGGGAGGGTSQATSAGGVSNRGGGGGGGGRSNTNVGTGGGGMIYSGNAGGATAGAVGADSPLSVFGGGGGAGGTSAAGPGGQGGWPGGGAGGGGSQSGAQRGGAGGDGVVTVITYC